MTTVPSRLLDFRRVAVLGRGWWRGGPRNGAFVDDKVEAITEDVLRFEEVKYCLEELMSGDHYTTVDVKS